jgi:hypothetical protein
MQSSFDLRMRTAYALRDSEALVRWVHENVRVLQTAAFVSSDLIRNSRKLLGDQVNRGPVPHRAGAYRIQDGQSELGG